jgi:hypothetical protein
MVIMFTNVFMVTIVTVVTKVKTVHTIVFCYAKAAGNFSLCGHFLTSLVLAPWSIHFCSDAFFQLFNLRDHTHVLIRGLTNN